LVKNCFPFYGQHMCRNLLELCQIWGGVVSVVYGFHVIYIWEVPFTIKDHLPLHGSHWLGQWLVIKMVLVCPIGLVFRGWGSFTYRRKPNLMREKAQTGAQTWNWTQVAKEECTNHQVTESPQRVAGIELSSFYNSMTGDEILNGS